MKKIIALVFCFLFIFTACSDSGEQEPIELNEDNFATYVGAGEMTLINILVNSNKDFVENVIIKGHLPVDETKTVKNGENVFAPVNSEEYKTLADLKSKLASIYVEDSVDEIIADKYADINGKLYFNLKYKTSDYSSDWSSPVISATIEDDGRYKIEITIKDAIGKDHNLTAYAVNENGNLKLETIYF